ncbi:hypothetical protein GGR92_001441 [Spirosoma lacussanchae]|uniref:hypothetical protein n=1 Tax=Spirosoma lacussanchae TaxID=1884249 RepID=UPI001109D2BB|nr:hypothetical protein [Spirosoma lacussanchae]
MKNALIYLLLVATLLPSVSQWGVIAYYHANKDYIARVLCENRDKPQLHCDGKCFLAKRLKASQERQDKETTERVQNLPTLQLFWNDVISFRFAPVLTDIQADSRFGYTLGTYMISLAPLFHPPRLVG